MSSLLYVMCCVSVWCRRVLCLKSKEKQARKNEKKNSRKKFVKNRTSVKSVIALQCKLWRFESSKRGIVCHMSNETLKILNLVKMKWQFVNLKQPIILGKMWSIVPISNVPLSWVQMFRKFRETFWGKNVKNGSSHFFRKFSGIEKKKLTYYATLLLASLVWEDIS